MRTTTARPDRGAPASGDLRAGGVAERRRTEIVAAAREILAASGPGAFTMRAVAERIGIRAPSLYKHFADKEALEVALVAEGLAEQADVFEAAVGSGGDRIGALGRAYRDWALAHAHLYRLMTDKPLPRTQLPPGLEARAARPLVEATGGDVDLARAAWGLAHGLTSLELAARFPSDADIDAAWAAGTSALVNDIARKGMSR